MSYHMRIIASFFYTIGKKIINFKVQSYNNYSDTNKKK
jgi:hypothetical protein